MTTQKVTLDPGQVHCVLCNGAGETCKRCGFPEEECECERLTYVYIGEECILCEGEGVDV